MKSERMLHASSGLQESTDKKTQALVKKIRNLILASAVIVATSAITPNSNASIINQQENFTNQMAAASIVQSHSRLESRFFNAYRKYEASLRDDAGDPMAESKRSTLLNLISKGKRALEQEFSIVDQEGKSSIALQHQLLTNLWDQMENVTDYIGLVDQTARIMHDISTNSVDTSQALIRYQNSMLEKQEDRFTP